MIFQSEVKSIPHYKSALLQYFFFHELVVNIHQTMQVFLFDWPLYSIEQHGQVLAQMVCIAIWNLLAALLDLLEMLQKHFVVDHLVRRPQAH